MSINPYQSAVTQTPRTLRQMWLVPAFFVLILAPGSAQERSTTSWQEIRPIHMKGDLKAFWNVRGRPNAANEVNNDEALKHGFLMVDILSTYADYPGKQKENIRQFLEERQNTTNPWDKPPFFERIIRRNIGTKEGNAIYVHDIEFAFERDPGKAWSDEKARAASGTDNERTFAERYLAEWATWFWLPCKWGKEIHPDEPIGIYGIQPFARDYYGFKNTPQELAALHAADDKLWEQIDPHVDFCISSIYVFYDRPESVYYMAANVEENVKRARRCGDKPVYAYLWLRYHDSNKKIGKQEVNPYLAEAMAVVPFFCGAKGIVLWGSESEDKNQYYQNFPLFMDSLGRAADLSEKISKAELIIDEPAHILWQKKQPLVRTFKVSSGEWILLVANPWQEPDAESIIPAKCGGKTVGLTVRGRHTEIYHLEGSKLKRLQASEK